MFFNEINYIITFKDRGGNVEKARKNTTNFVLPLSLLRPEVLESRCLLKLLQDSWVVVGKSLSDFYLPFPRQLLTSTVFSAPRGRIQWNGLFGHIKSIHLPLTFFCTRRQVRPSSMDPIVIRSVLSTLGHFHTFSFVVWKQWPLSEKSCIVAQLTCEHIGSWQGLFWGLLEHGDQFSGGWDGCVIFYFYCDLLGDLVMWQNDRSFWSNWASCEQD